MWIWLLAIFLLIVIWVGGLWIGGMFGHQLPIWACILFTVLVALMVVGWYVFKRYRAVMKARALEREIMRQAEQQAMNARPDRRAEIIELQMQVQRGLAALKTSRLGGATGGTALYTLPWYVIIGPPGAGKTTALKHSGLVFPFLDPQGGGGVRGIGGTRNCDWWFTNEAIMLDTAGRYATEADDHEEWLAFLGMLKRYRSRKPINGVIVAIAVSDLMDATEEQIDTYAKKLRARIDEVMTRLQMVVPVYVMFTKADLVAGFVEFWNDLRKSERAQIWGATFPLQGADQRDAARAFEAEFDQLVEAVHARAIRRIGTERQWEARQKIFQFPIEYQGLRNNLSEFINGLFQRNQFQETPIFRGVYFTSGTQEGRPIDRVIGGMMRAFNIAPPPTAAQQPSAESKSYFVTDLFRRVVFPDQFVAARTRAELRRQLINRLAFAAAALFLAALVLLPALITFYNNVNLVAETRARAAAARAASWDDKTLQLTDDPAHPDALMTLESLGTRVQELDKWQAFFDRPLEYRWGMYVGDDLLPAARTAYVQEMDYAFANRTRAALEQDIKQLTAKPMDDDTTYGVLFDDLKGYLEACGTKNDEGKIALENEDVKDDNGAIHDGAEVTRLTSLWRRTLNLCGGGSCRPDESNQRAYGQYRRMGDQVKYYLSLMRQQIKKEDGGVAWWVCKPEIVEPARAALNKVSKEQRVYASVKGRANDPNAGGLPISRESIFPPTSDFAEFISSWRDGRGTGVVIQPAFTKFGWEKFFRPAIDENLTSALNADVWVLGQGQDPKALKQADETAIRQFKSQYFNEYIAAWNAFLSDLKVESPQSNDRALKELAALATISPPDQMTPYATLFNAIHENTVLKPSEKSLADVTGNAIVDRFKDAGTQQFNKIVGLDGGAGPPPPPKKTDVELAFEPLANFGWSPPPAKEGDAKAPTKLDAYQEQVVSKLVGSLTDLQQSKGKGITAAQVTENFVAAMNTTNELITNSHQNGKTITILSPILRNPIQLGYQGVLNTLGGVAGGKWEPEVWKKWHLQLDDKYPFADSVKDASLKDFQAFFKPNGGLLWGFYDKNLSTYLEKQSAMDGGADFEPSVRFGSSIGFTPQFRRCYDRGADITTAVFPNAAPGEKPEPGAAPPGEAPLVEFDINLHSVSENVSEVTFAIDGVEKTYQNTPEEWIHVQWPAKEPKQRGGMIRIRGYDGLDEAIERPGDFGFFRLLDAAVSIERGTEGGKRNAPPTIVITWPLRSQNGLVRMDVKPSTNDNVFAYHVMNHQRIFRGYWCPRVIAIPVR